MSFFKIINNIPMCMTTANRFTLTFGDYLKLKDQWYYAQNTKMRFNPSDNSYGSNWQVWECFKVDKDFKIIENSESVEILQNYPELGIGDSFPVLRPCSFDVKKI